jgi:transcription elongation factor Elf1
MLILNDADRDEAGLVTIHFTCLYCGRDLEYPVVMVRDTNGTMYHASCALQLASEITDLMADYLLEMEQQQEESTMAAMFREAARQRTSPT